jgi:osmoprotectant transport system ATP-binding protein
MRALMLDPDALLLDEPMAALDPLVRAELQEDLRAAFARLGKTVVLVTHDIGEAAYLAERIVLLRDGRIVQQGTIADLVARPADAFVSRFLRAHRAPDLSGMPAS